MQDLELPTREKICQNQEDYLQYVINKNVCRVVKIMSSATTFSGSVNMEDEDKTFRSIENVLDCVVLQLQRLHPKIWHFRHRSVGQYINWHVIDWQDHPFSGPAIKPWWKIW